LARIARGHDDVMAELRELARDLETDAAVRAGDDGDLWHELPLRLPGTGQLLDCGGFPESAIMRILGTFVTLVAALAIAAAGWFIGDGLRTARMDDRYVTVKGLAEREVQADLAVWPIRYVATGNALADVQATLRRQTEVIRGFLEKAGISGAEIELAGVEVTDVAAQAWRDGPVRERFIVAQTLMVRTEDVAAVEAASRKLGELLEAGIVLSSDYGPVNKPSYVFTGLNDIKPEMIAEATRNARAGAEQFAADSGSRLGAIRRANQGLFQILPRNQVSGTSEAQELEKTVRVVSTLEYYLED